MLHTTRELQSTEYRLQASYRELSAQVAKNHQEHQNSFTQILNKQEDLQKDVSTMESKAEKRHQEIMDQLTKKQISGLPYLHTYIPPREFNTYNR